MMRKNDTIKITLKNGESAVWGADQWDDYDYGSRMFTIKKGGSLVGAYALDCVASIVMKDMAGGFFKESRTLGIGLETICVGPETIYVDPETICAGLETIYTGPETICVGPRTVRVGPKTLCVGPETICVGLRSGYTRKIKVR